MKPRFEKLAPYVPSFLVIVLFVLTVAVFSMDMEAQDDKFVEEFNRLVSVAMQQENSSDIKAIMPGCSTYLQAEDYAYLWQFRERYGLTNMPAPPDDYHKTSRFVDNLMNQCKAVDAYVKEHDLSREDVSAALEKVFSVDQMDLVRLVELEAS